MLSGYNVGTCQGNELTRNSTGYAFFSENKNWKEDEEETCSLIVYLQERNGNGNASIFIFRPQMDERNFDT